MKYRWSLATQQPDLAQSLATHLQISPLLAQCLLNRGFSEPEPIARFLEPRLAHLADPFALPQMDIAVERLVAARERREPLVIFGDYDVDGVTSAALLHEFLSALGWDVHIYLPHRIDEGYGLTQAAVEACLARHPVTLLLVVDCGSSSAEQIRWLRQRGVEVVVLDHHQVPDELPEATALVNPQLSRRDGSAGRFTELCSVGLAFKFAHALLKRLRASGLSAAHDFDLRPLLDLVGLGTIADLVPLTGENRIFASAGLSRLGTTTRPGLVALKELARVGNSVGVYEVGFHLGPRLNAAGRLETAEDALRLLQAKTVDEATALAQRLDACNRDRQQIERTICLDVLNDLRGRFDRERHFALVEGRAHWHIGVVGIVASRVLQEFYRPTVIVGGDGELWRGSGRSVDGFDLAAALRQCGDLLVRHGGHRMAAGVTIKPGNVDAFRDRLNELARQALRPEQLQPALRLDGEVTTRELTLERTLELQRLQHTGMGNPAVQFCLRDAGHARALQRLGADKQHAKMWVTDGGRTCEAVLWGAADGPLPVGKFDLAIAPQINKFNGTTAVQLKVLDWRPAGAAETML